MSSNEAATTEVPAPPPIQSHWRSLEYCANYLRPDKPLAMGTMYRWALEGRIPARKLNGVWLVNIVDLEQQLASKVDAPARPSLTPFEQARMRARSLKTEHTVNRPTLVQKRKRNGD